MEKNIVHIEEGKTIEQDVTNSRGNLFSVKAKHDPYHFILSPKIKNLFY